MDKRHFNMAEEKKFCVYVHINKSNGKRYVGITCREPEVRWGKGGYNYRSSPHFYSAIQKYGWDAFKHIIVKDNLLEQCAKTMEKVLIKLWDTTDRSKGYNISKGGDGNTGIHSKPSDKTKKKMSDSHKEMFLNGPCAKAVCQYTKDGILIKEWPSTMEIERELGLCNSNISRCCRGERKTAYGYVWSFKSN